MAVLFRFLAGDWKKMAKTTNSCVYGRQWCHIFFIRIQKKSLFLHKVKSLNLRCDEEIYPPGHFNGTIGCL